MGRKLLRALGLLAYAALVVLAFTFAAYLSFSFFVRSGVTSVPSVVGMTRAEAANVLVSSGLAVRGVTSKGHYDDKVPAGRVLRELPDARTLVKRGSGVQLVLSQGPQRIEVPDLAAKAFPAAQVTLSGSGLIVGKTLSAFVPGRETGTVVAQDPDPGAAVPPASPVDVLLAQPTPGDRYIMPDLVYQQYDRVRTFFEREKFRLGSVKFERYEGVAAGVILRQFPLPGHPVSHNDPVSLVVATAEDIPG
ncbi:MAG TPA: PASTA domain-containing protein [Thermoanaerobaculia bacterium]|nr:PASTA domain-containing protein [Thermoanaerobaculia bacterium]